MRRDRRIGVGSFREAHDVEEFGGNFGVLAEESILVATFDHQQDSGVPRFKVTDLLLQRRQLHRC